MRELPDFTDIIASAQRDLLEIKQRQFAGTSNIHAKEVQTANTWDIDTTINLVGPFYNKTYHFYFLADHQQAPIASFHPTVYINNVVYELDDNLFSQELVTAFDVTSLAPNDFTRLAPAEYSSIGTGATSFNLKVKMRVLANDTGTIGWTIS